MKAKLGVLAMIAALSVTGCADLGVGGADYTDAQARGVQSVQLGTVLSTRMVSIAGQGSMMGELAGGVAGAALGHTLGQGVGNMAASVLGALGGAAAGSAAENATVNKEKGVEITVKLDSGYVIAITQGADEAFTQGERIQVLGSGNTARVTRFVSGTPATVPAQATVPVKLVRHSTTPADILAVHQAAVDAGRGRILAVAGQGQSVKEVRDLLGAVPSGVSVTIYSAQEGKSRGAHNGIAFVPVAQ